MAKFCPECGEPLKENAKFCENCGAHVPVQTSGKPAGPAPAPQEQPPENAAPDIPDTTAPEIVKTAENKSKTVPQMPKSSVRVPEQFANRNKVNMPKSGVKVPEQFAAKAREKAEAQSSGGKKEPNASEKSTPPRKKGTKSYGAVISCVAVVLIVAFLFTAFIAPGFLRAHNDGGDGSGDTSLEVKEKSSGQVSESSPVVTLCGVKVDVVPEMLAGGGREVTVSKLETTTEGGVKSENYELEMGDHRKFDIPVEVTFPCTINGSYDPVVEHYDEDSKEWVPLISYADEKAGTVTAYFGSFSPARVSYLPVTANPNIFFVVNEDKSNPFDLKIAVSRNYWKILQRINPEVYSNEINKYIDDPSNYAVDFPKLDPKMDTKLAYEAFMNSNTIWSFCDPMINMGIEALPFSSQNKVVQFMIDHSGKLGEAMNAIPFVIMTAQLVYDLKDFDPDTQRTAAINLYKNLITSAGTIYSLATGYANIGFSLAFLGVSLFGMELDYFIDAAKAAQAENVAAVFNSYYENIEPFDSYHWFEVFHDAYWKNNGNADKAMKAVKDAVDAYCNQFWKIYEENGDDLWFATTEARYKNVFMNASPELKRSLTEQQKQKVWDLIERHSMKIIQRFLFDELQTNTLKQLASMTEPYNKERTLTIKETVNRGADAVLTGYTVCLGYGNDFIPFPQWHVNIPDDGEYNDGWSIDLDFTTYGYLNMGMPDRVMFYLDEEDFDEAVSTGGKGIRPSYTFAFSVDLNSKDPGTLVEINFGDPYQAKSDSFTGYDWQSQPYGGTISAATVNTAIERALRKMTFKLDKDGNFNAASSESYSYSGSGEPGPNDTYSYSANANVTLKGHIDKGTGDGTFEVVISVTYSHKTGSPYSGYDSVGATITIRGGGEIDSTINSDDTFDPRFGGYATVNRSGTWSHSKGTAQWDENGYDSFNTTDDAYIKMTFLANN
ncbi:MAG: zinc ribbon domain-containing protein [Clostridia bacterium]|nr:zinc ribbon domain-containing protein [Clostridia bacterium]